MKKPKKASNKPRKTRSGAGFEVVKHTKGSAPVSLIHPSAYSEALKSLRMLRSLGLEDIYLLHSSLFKEVLQLTPAQVKRIQKAKEAEEKVKINEINP